MHGSEYHQVDNLLSVEGLGSIEFTLEHTLGGPSLESMLPTVRRILETKPLVLAALDLETADRCIAELPPAGLCVTLGINDDEIPAEIARWLKNNCQE
jgi:nucleoside-triphosphatase THEP1